MLRFAKTVVITSANAKEGASVSDCERPGKRDAQYLRAIMERGLRTLPLEQRVLSEAAFDKRAFDLGKVFVIRQLGAVIASTWLFPNCLTAWKKRAW